MGNSDLNRSAIRNSHFQVVDDKVGLEVVKIPRIRKDWIRFQAKTFNFIEHDETYSFLFTSLRFNKILSALARG
jgi:hypothetical protein